MSVEYEEFRRTPSEGQILLFSRTRFRMVARDFLEKGNVKEAVSFAEFAAELDEKICQSRGEEQPEWLTWWRVGLRLADDSIASVIKVTEEMGSEWEIAPTELGGFFVVPPKTAEVLKNIYGLVEEEIEVKSTFFMSREEADRIRRRARES